MKTASVAVNVNRYLAAHGREPKGTGTWWFAILNGEYVYNRPYGQAVQLARREMKRQCLQRGISMPPAIVLLP